MRNRLFQIYVFAGFFLAVISLAYFSRQVYGQVAELTEVMKQAVAPNQKLLALRSLMSELTQWEIGIRDYALMQDEIQLKDYRNIQVKVKKNLSLIDSLYTEDTLARELRRRTELKFAHMDKMIQILDGIARFEDHDRIASKAGIKSIETEDFEKPVISVSPGNGSLPPVDKISSSESSDIVAEKKEKKKGWIRNLFSKKEAQHAEQIPTPQPKRVELPSLNTGIEAPLSKDKENPIPSKPVVSEYLLAKENELVALIDRDLKNTRMLRSILQEMEQKQAFLNELFTRQAERESLLTMDRMKRFVWGTSALLLLLMLSIVWELFRNKRLQRQLASEKTVAEKLARAKEEFLSNMSHELRTPMNAIIGFSDQLALQAQQPAQTRFVENIQHASNYLLRIINDILDYSKLESGKFTLEKISFSPQQTMKEVQELFLIEASNKGLACRVELSEGLPEYVWGDPLRLKQMLFNLVNNAIKFTEKGAVTLCARMADQEGKSVWAIEVQDTGIGIPSDKIDLVLQEFSQADTSTGRKFGGTGLGLSITRKLAELHQGTVKVTSQEGKGTTVSLLLPYEPAEAPVAVEGASGSVQSQAQPILRGLKVLVADDDAFNQELTQVILEKSGATATYVGDGQAVIEYLSKEKFDLLLLDLHMPHMDGFETARYIRKEMGLDLPILALTASSSPAERQAALKSGVDRVVLKPFREPELLAALADVIPGAVQPVLQETYSLETLKKLSGGNPEFAARIMRKFLETAPANVTGLEEGLREKDGNKLALHAHRLLPPARYFHAEELVETLSLLEKIGDFHEGNGQNSILAAKALDEIKRLCTFVERQIKA